jgi:hypothetical protein
VQARDAVSREREQRVELVAAEGMALGRTLDLDESSA